MTHVACEYQIPVKFYAATTGFGRQLPNICFVMGKD